jgi:DNA repair protein RadC
MQGMASKFIGEGDREVFFIMCLNKKNQVTAVHRAHVGGLDVSLVVPMEVFISDIQNNSINVIF